MDTSPGIGKPTKTKRTARIRYAAALVAALVLATIGVAASQAAGRDDGSAKVLARTSSVTIVQDGDWIRHQYTTSIPSAVQTTLSGVREISADGTQGCHYHGTETRAANDLTRNEIEISRQIASNLTTCTMVIQTGTINVGDAEAFGATPKMQSIGSSSESATSGGLTTNSSTSQMYQKLYYEDPIHLDTSSVTVKLAWTWDGSCTTWAYHEADWGWYTPSGWSRTNYWWGYDGANCQYGAATSNTASYENSAFCGPQPTTHNEYYTNYFQGHSDGGSYQEWDADNWGGCAQLLSFHRAFGYY